MLDLGHLLLRVELLGCWGLLIVIFLLGLLVLALGWGCRVDVVAATASRQFDSHRGGDLSNTPMNILFMSRLRWSLCKIMVGVCLIRWHGCYDKSAHAIDFAPIPMLHTHSSTAFLHCQYPFELSVTLMMFVVGERMVRVRNRLRGSVSVAR